MTPVEALDQVGRVDGEPGTCQGATSSHPSCLRSLGPSITSGFTVPTWKEGTRVGGTIVSFEPNTVCHLPVSLSLVPGHLPLPAPLLVEHIWPASPPPSPGPITAGPLPLAVKSEPRKASASLPPPPHARWWLPFLSLHTWLGRLSLLPLGRLGCEKPRPDLL